MPENDRQTFAAIPCHTDYITTKFVIFSTISFEKYPNFESVRIAYFIKFTLQTDKETKNITP